MLTTEASSDVKEEKMIDSQDQDDDESYSDQEDMAVPNPFQGDGRKREAKRHKSKVVVA